MLMKFQHGSPTKLELIAILWLSANYFGVHSGSSYIERVIPISPTPILPTPVLPTNRK